METLDTPIAPTKPKKYGLGLRSKFLFVLLGSTIACILITAYQSLNLSQGALDQSLTKHLTSLRGSRLDQVQSYFNEKRSQMNVFSDNPSIVEAMKEFTASVSLLEHYSIAPTPEEMGKLATHYKTELIPQLEAITGEIRIADQFIPKGSANRYLQYHYIVNNPAPVGNKQLYESANDGSYYSELHQKHHSNMLGIAEGFGFYDLFLIDSKQSKIVYSVYKELDFATNLNTGPYSNSNLASTIRKVMSRPEKGTVVISDYQSYEPSLGQAAAFMAVPIYDDAALIGVLAAQVPVQEINKILTNDKNWVRDGLGKTGEVYLVGHDKKMRSNSRFIHPEISEIKPESKTEVIANESTGATSKQVETAAPALNKTDEINNTQTPSLPVSSILMQRVDNEAVTDAIRGNTGIKTVTGYKGYKVLSSYAPLNVPGLDWVLMAEKGYEEAHDPITAIEKALLTGASITAAIMTLYALFVSNVFVGPVQSMLTHVESILSGEKTEPLNSNRKDEFGLLSQDINTVTERLNSQQEQNQQQAKLLKERLLMIFPASIAEKFDAGQSLIADKFQNVAVIVIHFTGFSEASSELSAKDTVKMLNQIISNFDDAAQNYSVDKITSQGTLYLAASGLMNPRLDYARNAVAFAEEILLSIHRFNIAHGDKVSANIGISSGDVTAGVIGKKKPIYNLMGETVSTANVLAEKASTNSIKIDAPVFNQLLESKGFSTCKIISHPFLGEVANWESTIQSNHQDRDA